MRIKNKSHHEQALVEIQELFHAQFEPGHPRENELLNLYDAIVRYEDVYYPIGEQSKLQRFIAWLKWMLG